MPRDCHVCKSEGFEALNRIRVSKEGKTLVASLIVMDDLTICVGDGLNDDEVIALTWATIHVGFRLKWEQSEVLISIVLEGFPKTVQRLL